MRRKMTASSAMALKSHRKLLGFAMDEVSDLGFRERWLCEGSHRETSIRRLQIRATVPLSIKFSARLSVCAGAPLVTFRRNGEARVSGTRSKQHLGQSR
jgi:hypothetical protein